MSQVNIPLIADQYYHLYNRGNNRGDIFFERKNYLFFLQRVREYLSSDLLVIAYVLMPNHYHLLIQALTDNAAHAIQRFGISNTKAINKHYNRVGSLYQGKFKRKLVDTDTYLLYLSRYIHLNPVQAGLAQKAEDWEFSSYQDYLGIRNGKLPKPDIVLNQFDDREAYRKFVEEYREEDGRGISHLLFD